MQSNDRVITKIVIDEADVSGMMAYYSYKIKKLKFCQGFQEKHNRLPNENELSNFVLTIDDDYIKLLRNNADRLLKEFIKESAERFIKDEVKKAKDEIEKTEAKNNKELKMALSVAKQPGYWYGVSQGIVASFCFVLMIGVLAFTLSSLSIDVAGLAKKIGEHFSSSQK